MSNNNNLFILGEETHLTVSFARHNALQTL